MRVNTGSLSACVFLVTVGFSRAEAQNFSEFHLSTDRVVYSVKDTTPVTGRLSNDGIGLNLITPPVWSVWKGNFLVCQSIVPSAFYVFPKGGTSTWTWDKKAKNGKPVGPGSYTISVTLFRENLDGSVGWVKFFHTVALTPTGSLAGKSLFPIAYAGGKGNEWVYRTAQGNTLTTKVVGQSMGWFKVLNLLGSDRLARMLGSGQSVLWVAPFSSSPASAQPLFRFGLPLKATYSTGAPPFSSEVRITIGATQATVHTPAGTFTGCVRLRVDRVSSSWWGTKTEYLGSFEFAPGIGLVQYRLLSSDYGSLMRATLRGTDGQWYRIGQ